MSFGGLIIKIWALLFWFFGEAFFDFDFGSRTSGGIIFKTCEGTLFLSPGTQIILKSKACTALFKILLWVEPAGAAGGTGTAALKNLGGRAVLAAAAGGTSAAAGGKAGRSGGFGCGGGGMGAAALKKPGGRAVLEIFHN